MINHLKINNFEFTADNRAYAKISGLEPTDVAVDLISAGGHKKITGSTRDNRIIQITGVVVDVSFIKDIYKHLVVGNEYEIEVGTDDSEKRFYTDGIVTEIIVDRYKLPVTYTVKITCTSAYLYGKITTYGGAEAVDVSLENEYDIPQTAIKISHTIAANEETVTFNFFGTTTVNVGTDNVDL